LRDGADVEIPNQTVKIAAPSGGNDDAARAAQRAQAAAALAKSCSEDIKKFCPSTAPGRETRLCLIQNRDSVSADCSKVLSQMRRGGGAGGGRRGGGGGGGP